MIDGTSTPSEHFLFLFLYQKDLKRTKKQAVHELAFLLPSPGLTLELRLTPHSSFPLRWACPRKEVRFVRTRSFWLEGPASFGALPVACVLCLFTVLSSLNQEPRSTYTQVNITAATIPSKEMNIQRDRMKKTLHPCDDQT